MSLHRSRWAALGAAVAVTLGAGGFGLAQAATGPSEISTVEPITSCRLADTRPGGKGGHNAPLVNAAATTFTVRGTNGDCTIPSTATAVVLNLTGLNATMTTYLAVFAADVSKPGTSVMNLEPGKLASNEILVPLSADGKIKVYNNRGLTDVLLDVSGYYTTTDLDGRYDTSSEVDAKIASIDGYTDAEVDALIATLAGYSNAEIDAKIAAAPFAKGWHRDEDGDGFGDPFQTVVSNTQPAGYVSNYGDCNDYDDTINPDAVEIADSPGVFGIMGYFPDENCDGAYDVTYSDDGDLDGFGGPNGIVVVTVPNSSQPPLPPAGKVGTGDCDDADPQVNPHAYEEPNFLIDVNCDGLLQFAPYADNDVDGFGEAWNFSTGNWVLIAVGDPIPTPPSGSVFDATDCNDSDPAINPGATETAGDGIDSNCNFDDDT